MSGLGNKNTNKQKTLKIEEKTFCLTDKNFTEKTNTVFNKEEINQKPFRFNKKQICFNTKLPV